MSVYYIGRFYGEIDKISKTWYYISNKNKNNHKKMEKNMFHPSRLVFRMDGSPEKGPRKIEGGMRVEPEEVLEITTEDRTEETEAQFKKEVTDFVEGEDFKTIMGKIKAYFESEDVSKEEYDMAVGILKDRLKEVAEMGEDVRITLEEKIEDELFYAAGTEEERALLFGDVYGEQEEFPPLKSIQEQVREDYYKK